MGSAPKSKKRHASGGSAAEVTEPGRAPTDDALADPTAGMVLHRVLAHAARTFLLNDMEDELRDAPGEDLGGPADPMTVQLADRPLWAQSASPSMNGTRRRTSEVERIHQSRVALRRIRSNLRTFRLALDPSWGTSLRAELAWYGRRLGQVRDLHILREIVTVKGPEVVDPDFVDRLDSLVGMRMAAALAEIAEERRGARRFQLNEQMMLLWDGPEFKAKAKRPASEILPPMLHRAWHDLRGAARSARKDKTDANLHKLRIRLKDLRYGCETVALVEGGPARKTARAAEALQSKLGDLHDADFAIDWFEELALEYPGLGQPLSALAEVEREAARAAKKGWNRELKVVERRWRDWKG
jgi:CHAD domain-containing protein